MDVHIIDNNRYLSPQRRKALKGMVKLILKHLGITGRIEICITLVGDCEMRKLNRTYRGIDKTTDVLSFPQADSSAAIANTINNPYIKPLGDIVISLETAERHTKTYKTTIEKETEKLIVHGTLHLLGYDHKRKKQREEMRRKEKELLRLIRSTPQVP